MKVTSKTEATLRYAYLKSEQSKPKSAVVAADKDNVSISPAARLLQECLATQEPYDQDKVCAIRSAMARGDYQVDNKVLADRLLAEMARNRRVTE